MDEARACLWLISEHHSFAGIDYVCSFPLDFWVVDPNLRSFSFEQGTRAALTVILYYVKKFDAELGDFREYAKRTE
jgi:hypothetical protein